MKEESRSVMVVSYGLFATPTGPWKTLLLYATNLNTPHSKVGGSLCHIEVQPQAIGVPPPGISGEASAPRSLDRVKCIGNETNLLDCSFNAAERACDHSVVVHCSASSLPQRDNIGELFSTSTTLLHGTANTQVVSEETSYL